LQQPCELHRSDSEFEPDIAILDISLPGLTGLEILSIANSEMQFRNLLTRQEHK